MTEAELRTRRAAAAAALTTLAAGALFCFGPARAGRAYLPGTDGEAYVALAARLGSERTIELPPPGEAPAILGAAPDDLRTTPYARGRDGRLLPKHPIPYAAVLVPGVALLGTTGALVTSIAIGAAVAGLAAARAARHLPAPAAALVASAILLGLPASREALLGIGVDAFIALLFLAAAALAVPPRLAPGAACVGWIAATRPTAALLAAVLPAVSARLGRPRAGRAAGAALLALVAVGVWNAWLWGASWENGYTRTVVFGPNGPEIRTHAALFGGDVLAGFGELLFGWDGLLQQAAPAFVAAGALALLGAARGGGDLAVFLVAAANTAALATYGSRQPRMYLPLVVASVAPTAAVLSAMWARSAARRRERPART